MLDKDTLSVVYAFVEQLYRAELHKELTRMYSDFEYLEWIRDYSKSFATYIFFDRDYLD